MSALRERHGDRTQELLDLHVGSLIERADLLKVGFAIPADLEMLRQSFPEARCFAVFIASTIGLFYPYN